MGMVEIRDLWNDHADALLLVLEKGVLGRSYNIGGENERTNLDLVKTCEILDRLQPRNEGSYADQSLLCSTGLDMMHVMPSVRGIRDELGWRPSVTIEEV